MVQLHKGTDSTTLGARLRTARHDAGLTMRELATDVGLSQPFLSQVERGKARPSVATLTLLAQRLGISVDSLVSWRPPDPQIAISRAGDGWVSHVTEVPNAIVRWLAHGTRDIEMFEIRSPQMPRWSSAPRSHDGTEVIYIVEGRLTLELEGHEPTTLEQGDSACFDSATSHRWHYEASKPVTLVCAMISPP